ncbi:uncharacterized protein [Euwallacea fornicatus]|uniref:uncharacterized protein n=1 Tax=Euwallacea fornicatus TaxID=995702 RepID=UPI00338EA1E6
MYAFAIVLYLIVSYAQCQSSSETTEIKTNPVTLEALPQEQELSGTGLASSEGEQTEQKTTTIITEDSLTATKRNSIRLEENPIREEQRPSTTTQQIPTNQSPDIPIGLSQNERPTDITIDLPTGTDESVTLTEQKEITHVPTCGENEDYDCLPLCPRRCSLLSKIVCRKLPTFIWPCHKGCTCRPGYSLDRTTDTCIKHC